MKIIIVNDGDVPIGTKENSELTSHDIYRVSALWLTSSSREILLARRHRNKKQHPGLWGPAVAGTLEEGETYAGNIVKEAQEELGLVVENPALGPKTETKGEYHHFTQWFTYSLDKEKVTFILEENEVEEVRWFKPEELRRLLVEQPELFLPSMADYFALFCS